MIGGEEDQIIPAHLTEKNFKAYRDAASLTEFLPFAGRSHYICNEPGWHEVADPAYQFIERNSVATGGSSADDGERTAKHAYVSAPRRPRHASRTLAMPKRTT